ncbi:MAG: CRISPR-associated endonuclease Cas2 [Alphaproteobacteria bacterium]|nr:CRISPR-associated endonuclease Cas2 [Alphaproteobacteria bacterium]
MYVILVYDVAAKRDTKVMKICRKYLSHDQRSVFEGILTESQLKHLKRELKGVVDVEEDCINIYEFDSLKYTAKESIGMNTVEDNIL